MVDNPRPLTPEEEIALALRNSQFQDRSAVAESRGNDYANEQLQTDLRDMSVLQLRAKYGDDVAINRHRLIDGRNRLEASDNSSLPIGEKVSDAAFAFGNSVYRGIGTLSNLAYGYAEGILDGDPNTTGSGQAAKYLDAHNQVVAIMQQVTLSEELQKRQYFEAIASELDKEDSANQAQKEIEAGSSPFWAEVRQQGRDALNALERNASDPMLATNIIADGIGSLASSVPLAGAGGLIAKGASSAIVKNALIQRVALATGTSVGAGISEVSGVYAQAASDIMGMDTAALMESSSIMRTLVAEGLTPEEAKVQLAGMTAETAAVRQLAPALALGFITSKFERMPVGSFAGVGVAKGLLQVAGEGIEEFGQEFSGAINQNISVEQYAQVGRSALEGAGEQGALGMLGGLGMAGVSATPHALSAGADSARIAADAIFKDTEYVDIGTGETKTSRAPASRVADAAIDLAGSVVEKASETVKNVANSNAMSYTTDFIYREGNKEAKVASEKSVDLANKIQTSIDDQTMDQAVSDSLKSTEVPSPSFKDISGNNVVENLGAITAKMSERGFRLSEEDTAYANSQVQRLRQVTNSLPAQMQRDAGAILSSSVVKDIEEKAKAIDLNKVDSTTEITPQEVSVTVSVAKSNPANVNPARTDRILKESGESISEQDLKITRAASNISRAINTNLDTKIEIERGQTISLSQVGEKPKRGESVKSTTRSIFASGFKTRSGKELPSINEMAANIIQGIQSPDGSFINIEGRKSTLKEEVKRLHNFIQHMNNRVSALNESFSKNRVNPKTGKMSGPSVKFRGLANGTKWVEADDAANYFAPVYYHRGSPASVATALQIEADTRTAETVLASIQKEFPEIFQDFGEVMPVKLKRDNPTASEETSTPQAVEATSKETEKEQTPLPTAVEEETSVSDEQPKKVSKPVEKPQPPTANDETGTVDERTDEAIAESVNEETIAVEEIDHDLTDANFLRKLRSILVKEDLNVRRGNARNFLERVVGKNNSKATRDIQVFKNTGNRGVGYVWYDNNRVVYLREDLFDENHELNDLGKTVLIHENAHFVDYLGDPDAGIWYSKSKLFYPEGLIYEEIGSFPDIDWVNERLNMVNNYEGHDKAKELFAVLSEFHFSSETEIFKNSPNSAQLMESIYGKREATSAGLADSRTQVEDLVSSDTQRNEDTDTTAQGTEEAGVNPVFFNHFKEKNTKDFPKNLNEFIEKMSKINSMNTKTLEFIQTLVPVMKQALSNRLNQKIKDGNVTKTIREHIKDGRTEFNQFKSGILIDPNTGEFNESMVELATIAMADWLLTNRGSNPNRLDDTLEKMGLSIHDISDDNLNAIMNGVPPSFAADSLASDILRMWDVTPNEDSALNDVHGISQGFAKEMFEALSAFTDLVTVTKVTLASGETTETILVNNKEMTDIRKEVMNANGIGKKLSSKEVLFNEERSIYSVGEKIPYVAAKQERGDVRLSDLERKALKNMQDTPNYLDETFATFLANMSEKFLPKILGFREDVEEIKNPVLRRSVRGKNASIMSNINEIEEMGNIESLDGTVPVYFPVGITKVGRHQYQGPNVQSNKLMRALITSTWSTVSLSNLDNFWIAVGQASGIKGINKSEKLNHAKIIEEAPAKFYEKYGKAVEQVKFVLNGKDADEELLINTLGIVEPQQLKAIIAVAQMEMAVESGASDFRTSLSFELDGLTNGVANMMMNFGQGVLTDEDFMNLQRVGMFLGKKNETVNNFFGKVGNLDMYETVSRLGDKMMMAGLDKLKPWQKEQRLAAGRLSTVIGNFEMVDGQFKMTRDTAKNPMTKVNYGSGVKGVAVGVADDMLLNFYTEIQNVNGNISLDEHFYPGFVKDMASVGLNIPRNVTKSFTFSSSEVTKFQTAIQYSLGRVLTDATKKVIGSKITDLNDLLVLSTNVQSMYLQKIFDKKLDELGEKLAKEGVIKRGKDGSPLLGTIPVKHYKALQKELSKLAPIFVSDEQSLAIGGFKKKLGKLVTSSSLSNSLNQKAVMPLPDDVGVRAIPFTVIGTGDAMMMNLIFGSDGAPKDALGIFDGLDIPLSKIQDYAPYVNQQVLRSWDRDVLSMVVANFEGFIGNPEIDKDVLDIALQEVLEKNKNESLNGIKNIDDISSRLAFRLKENRARKQVFTDLAKSVDQMGGSNKGYTRDGEELSISGINTRIERLLEGKEVVVTEKVKSKVLETTSYALMKSMKFSEEQRKVMTNLLKGKQVRVVMGTVEQLREWSIQNLPDSVNVVPNAKGSYDPQNNVMFLTTQDPTTFVHEMVHAETFLKVLEHYEGNKNKWVENLEVLMNEFLSIDSKSENVRQAQAAILEHINHVDPYRKAAALNEFMAYSLSNRYVSKTLKNKETSLLKTLSEKVIQLMRRLLGGVPSSMFDHVVFNTRMLIYPNLESTFGVNEGGDGGNGDGGSTDNDNLTPESNNYKNYWIQKISEYIDSLDVTTETGLRRSANTSQDLLNADKIIDSLRQVGLLRNPEERQVFRAIYAIIKSEMILDSNSLIALTKIFQHVEENMNSDMFGTTSEARNTYSAVLNSFGGFKRGETSDAVAVLFALSQTSQRFRKVLDQIPNPAGEEAPRNLNEMLTRGVNVFMQKLMGSLAEGAPKEVMDGLKKSLIQSNNEAEYAALRKVTSSLDKADKMVSGVFSNTAGLMRKIDRETKENSANTVKQYLVSSFTLITNYLDRPGTKLNAEVAQNAVHSGIPILSLVPVRELVDEMIGTTKDNKALVAMLDVVNSKIAGVRQAFREQLPGILNRQFNTEPNAEQWSSMQKVLGATDFTRLVDLHNIQASMQLLEESGLRQSRIQSLETQLQGILGNASIDAIAKSKQLADFMNGKGAGKLLMRNAYAIAKNIGGTFNPSVVPVLDELISLYAVDTMDSSILEETIQMWHNEPRAFASLVSYMKNLNEAEDQKAVSELAKLNGYKGYMPNVGKDNHRVVIAPDQMETEMLHRGFKKISPYTGDPSNVVPHSYYVTNISQQGMYSQGIMQNVSATYRGVDINTGMTISGDTSGFITDSGSVETITETMLDPSFELEDQGETMIPVLDHDGTVMGYEPTINPVIAESFLGRNNNLARNMGVWQGRQVEEELAFQYNKALVEKLDEMWQNRSPNTDHQYVNLKTTKDKIYAESFRLIPQNVKNVIDGLFDGEGMMVHESMVNLSVGYREFSLADLWTGKTRMPTELVKAVRAVTRIQLGSHSLRTLLLKAEKGGQSVISDAKDIIVIKSLIVPLMNTQANIIQLATNGIPSKKIVQSYRSKLAEIVEYNKNLTKLIELRALEDLTFDPRKKRILADKIQVIEDLNAKMSIAPMIEAGAYKQISEGITDLDVAATHGGLAEWLEQQAEKLPETMGSLMKIGMVSKSSEMYRAANRATQYGDFLAKSIYYDHLMSQGLSKEEAISQMNEEFVNFSYLPGRVRSGLERNGLSWFMAFKLRIVKIALRQMQENPVRAMALNSMFDFGSPIHDNIFMVIGEGRLDYATGFEMLFGAPELNPWVNLMNG